MSKIRRTAWIAVHALIAGAALAMALPALGVAAATDYRFELAGPPVKSGPATVIKVRLIHTADGKPVAGAIINPTRFDMAPDGMATMTAPAKAVAPAAAGIYQIKAEPNAAGNWGLTLAAKVQGEPETVSGTLTVPIAK